jgi:hypothetical protein
MWPIIYRFIQQVLYRIGNFITFFLLALQPIVGLYFAALLRTIASSRTKFLDHRQRRATVHRTPMEE